MALAPGQRLGTYEILGPLGAGGMGEVYRATDTSLGRQVAIKVLPEAFAQDADRLARFEREAKTLAALNHPNIAQIYGFERSSGIHALVMELVEGPTLAERIEKSGSKAQSRGQSRGLPLDEALAIANQIADALEAAHELGIVHRDLKPANVKVRGDGTVKVLDFGLAKLSAPNDPNGPNDPNASQSPTISLAATRMGVILGTAAYMSPEQAKGRTVDKRADIWAFGCVLYEMLTGRRPFDGADVSEILASVITSAPDWQALPPGTPPRLRALLLRCLQKEARHRLRDIGDARIEIDEILAAPAGDVPAAVTLPHAPRRDGVAWSVAAVAVVALGATLAAPYVRSPAAPPEMRVEITTPGTADPVSFAISPDGRQLVFVATTDSQSQLWLRSLDAVSAQPLAGTEGAAYPFWSPDSRSIGFFSADTLKRVDVGGGPAQMLADSAPRGGAWNTDGSILYSRTANGPLFRLPASGGEAVAVTTLEPGQVSHRFPRFLPGGRQFLFYALGSPDVRGVYLGSLDSTATVRLTTADAPGVYVPPNWLLFVRQGTLLAQRLDIARGVITGNPVTVADSVNIDGGPSLAALSASATGLVAYRAGGVSRRQLAWFDRSGKALGMFGEPDENGAAAPRISPDGRRVLVYRTVQGNADIWLVDAVRTSRLTLDPGLDRFPIWSPDGSRIVFDSVRKARRDLYVKPSNGAGGEELLLESPQNKTANDWSADGRFLMYHAIDERPTTGYDLWVLPLQGDSKKPFAWLSGRFDERFAAFSPDDRWVAYASNESGRYEVYVRSFLGADGDPAQGTESAQWQISTAGGIWQRWRPDGKELYYIAPDGKMMAASIAVSGTTINAGAPVALFQTQIVGGGTTIDLNRQYDVTPDGRFLINVATDQTTASPMTLILNWGAGGRE